jgi:peptidoglycan/LPS O-acetylase OafA/YrhL
MRSAGAEPLAAARDPGKERRRAAGIPVVPAFDGYRAYAIAGIVVLHVLIYSGALGAAGTGWAAQLVQATLGQLIDVLFVISGFVVFLPAAARSGDLGDLRAYAVRRAARLAPAYWLVLVLVLVLIAVIPLDRPLALPGPGAVAVHAAFLQAPAALLHPLALGFGVDGPVWTLSLEVAFYGLLPLVARWYFRRPLLGLALAALLTAAWHEAIIHLGAVLSALDMHPAGTEVLRLSATGLMQFPFFAFSFALGMTGAWAYVRLRDSHAAEVVRRRVALAQLASLVALVVCGYLVARRSPAGGILLGAETGRLAPLLALGYSASLATLMVATALGANRWQRPFTRPLARRLGDVSYGVYLIHVVVATYAVELLLGAAKQPGAASHLVHGDGDIGTVATLATIVMPLSLLYGYASARFLEQPVRRWAARFGRGCSRDEKATVHVSV